MTQEPLDVRTAPAEPLRDVGAITAAAVAIIALLISFGLPIDNNQQAAILGVVAVLGPLVTALWGRLKVYSPRTVARLLATCRARPAPPQ
jgi:hypothetical protein